MNFTKAQAEAFVRILLQTSVPLSNNEPGADFGFSPVWEMFMRRSQPPISVEDYVVRLVFHLKLDEFILQKILVYKIRLAELAGCVVDKDHAHRFLIASVTIAYKLCREEVYSLSYISKVGGVGVKELQSLEFGLCQLLDWRI